MDSCFNTPLLTPNHLKFYPSKLSKCRNLRKYFLEKLLALKNETKDEIISGTFFKICSKWLILIFFLSEYF